MAPSIWLVVACIVAALCEACLFLMQRSALEICRASDIDARTSRHMLPLWYALVWPVKAAKWIAAVLLWRAGDLFVALTIVGVAFLLNIVIPVPHSLFVPLFERKVSNDIAGDNPYAAKLLVALMRVGKRQATG